MNIDYNEFIGSTITPDVWNFEPSIDIFDTSVGEELSSTDARITIQDGSIFSPTNYPQATTDTYLDEARLPQTGY